MAVEVRQSDPQAAAQLGAGRGRSRRRGPEIVGVNTGHPNPLVGAALAAGAIPELAGYDTIRREVKYGKNSRVDFLLEGRPAALLRRDQERAHDAAAGPRRISRREAERGRKHLDELGDAVEAGARAVMLYLIQIGSAERFALARDIDPKYGAAFDRARSRGVEAMAWRCVITLDGIEIAERVPMVD